ncbi:MAG: WecB/TagA/CpsF family glycosyltransferase [Rhodobacterales bacterium]|nr:WecB/TagA/CpsF family glycosyltransferase [Rhodobacterales bacterium]
MEFQVGSERFTVNVPDRATLESEVTRRLSTHRGFALATLNLDHLVKLIGNDDFRAAYHAQDLITADGNPIVWMAHAARRPVDLLAGADLVLPLCQIAADTGARIALVGSTDSSLVLAAEAIRAAIPGVDIALSIAPTMGFNPTGPEAATIIDRLSAAGIGLCFLALGAPKQECVAAFARTRAPEIGFASIGAGLDFLSGVQKRAPKWVRALSLEWMWRLLSNPRRMFMRYLKSALIIPGHLWRSLRLRNKPATLSRP